MKVQTGIVLIDTGPLVAIVDEDEGKHKISVDALRDLPRRTHLVTSAAVLTEAFYLLSSVKFGQERLFELISSLKIALLPLSVVHLSRVQELMQRYHDLPMDFADGVLVTLAEEMKIRTVFTLDRRGFELYRPVHIRHFSLLP